MNDDIIRMAREAGGGTTWWPLHTDTLERFAALVAAAERERIIAQNAPEIEKINAHIKTLEKALEDEREACAKVCEDDFGNGALNLAAAIRARGNT